MLNTYAEAYRIDSPRQILDADRWTFLERSRCCISPAGNQRWSVSRPGSRALHTDAHLTPQAAIDDAMFQFRLF